MTSTQKSGWALKSHRGKPFCKRQVTRSPERCDSPRALGREGGRIEEPAPNPPPSPVLQEKRFFVVEGNFVSYYKSGNKSDRTVRSARGQAARPPRVSSSPRPCAGQV